MKRIALIAFALLLVAGIAGCALIVPGWRKSARVGAGYVAKQVCSCLHVSERPFAACRADVPENMAPVRAEEIASPLGVRAWVPLLAERVAVYRPETGCTLDGE